MTQRQREKDDLTAKITKDDKMDDLTAAGAEHAESTQDHGAKVPQHGGLRGP